MRLKDKKIIVTAAAQGIGKATALAFAKEGAKVTAIDINENKLSELSLDNKDINTFVLDSTSKNDVENFSKKIDDINVLFHAVGFVHHGSILECNEKEWDFSFNINIKSMYFMTKSILPKMIKQNKGSIINISSIASSLKGLPNRFVYGTTKAAIIGFTKAVAKEVAKRNITVNCVTPGYLETETTAILTDAQKEFWLSAIPQGKFGELDDISNLVLYLSDEKSKYITGQVISVDGGMAV